MFVCFIICIVAKWWISASMHVLRLKQTLTVFLFLLSFPRQAYENCSVLEARICYNVAKLMSLMSERYQRFNFLRVLVCVCVCARMVVCVSSVVSLWLFGSGIWASVWHSCSFACRKKTERSKKFFLDLQAKESITTMVNPKPCGHLCCCVIQGCEQVRLTSVLYVKQMCFSNQGFILMLRNASWQFLALKLPSWKNNCHMRLQYANTEGECVF